MSRQWNDQANFPADRRHFLKSIAATTLAGSWMASQVHGAAMRRTGSAMETVNIACCGVGGKGQSDMTEVSFGHNIVAICDVDAGHLAKAAEQFPKAKRYADWRNMLEQTDIDAVTITTPDHMHAPVTLAAMSLGKHVYTQKPLTHNIEESRKLTHAAKTRELVTQMGIQNHSKGNIRSAVQVIRDGVIGKVSEVHAWTDRPGKFWKQGLKRPDTKNAAPKELDWDLWLGVAPERPFVEKLYHPFHWRGWWDFGTGAGGDMGCHLIDPVFTALELGPPKTVTVEGPRPDAESGPLWCVVNYEFPGTARTTDTVKLTWYEAGKQPDPELIKAPADWPGTKNGILFIGEKGNLCIGVFDPPLLFPAGDFADYKIPELESLNHYTEWTDAIVGKGKTSCPFEYSGPLTEAVLLGNVAFRSDMAVDWDHDLMVARGNEKAEAFIRREYRKGWEIE